MHLIYKGVFIEFDLFLNRPYNVVNMDFLSERIKGFLGYLAGGSGLYLIWLVLFKEFRLFVLVGGVFVTAFALFFVLAVRPGYRFAA